MNTEPVSNPKPKKSKGAFIAAGAGMFLLGGVWLALKVLKVESQTPGNVTPLKGGKKETPKQEAADEERRRLMSEMGKKGAQKRWANKNKKEEKADENQDEETE